VSEIIIHIDFMQDDCSRLKDLSELWGVYPVCAICGQKLKDGDLIDGHFPHMDNYSRCGNHKNIPLDDDREYEYLRKEED
jgi:hypothetical protein